VLDTPSIPTEYVLKSANRTCLQHNREAVIFDPDECRTALCKKLI
jgi:hypothetical protein